MSPLGLSYADRLRSGAAKPTLGGPFDTRTRTVGGAYGNPGATPLPMERGPAPQAVPLGMAPSNQVDFQQQMQAQNRVGNTTGALFGGALPTMVTTAAGPRPGFMSEPMRDMSQKPQFPANEYRTTESGALTPRSASYGMGSMTVDEKKKLQEGRQAYQAKRQGVLDSRRAQVVEKSQERSEARRARRGLFTPEEQLNRADPAAYQARTAEEAKAKAFAENAASDRASRERLGLAGIAQRDRATEAGLAAKRLEAGKPESGQTTESPVDTPDSTDLANLSPNERKEVLKNYPAATRNRIESELSRKGYLSRLFGEIDQPGQAPISKSLDENATLGSMSPFHRALAAAVNTPTIHNATRNPKFGPADMSRIPLEKLKDQPGDTPAQKRIKAEERAKRKA